jgi:hypothetical protein
MQRLCFPTLPSAQAGQQQGEAHLRPTITKQVLCAETTQDGDAIGVLTRKGDYMFSFGMQDGLYALGKNQRTATISP